MKRLLGLTGLSCLVILTACFYLGVGISYIFLFLGILLFILSMVIPKLRNTKVYPVFFATVFITSLVFVGYTHLFITPVQTQYDNKEVQIEAIQAEDVYYAYGYYNYELKIQTINNEKVNTGIIIRSDEALYTEVGDEFILNCTLSSDMTNSEISRGCLLKSYIFNQDSLTINSPENKPLTYYLSRLRRGLEKNLFLEMDYDTASFSSAVLLGNKYILESEAKELLRVCGLSHISVVSGLHLSLITSITGKIFRKLTKNKYISGILNIVAILLFAMLTGMGKPVIRASVMLIICTIGTMINRSSDSLNSIGAAALVLIFINPYCVGDIGMLLSFSCVIGIVLWSDGISDYIMGKLSMLRLLSYRPLYKIIKALVDIMAMSICAAIWSMPIAILYFGGFSSVSVLANTLVVPFMSLVLVCIGFCAVTHYISFLPVLADTFAFIVNSFYKYLIKVCTLLSSIPYSYISADDLYFIFWLSATLLLVGVSLLISTKKAYVSAIFLSILILIVGSASHSIVSENTITLHMPDTKDGLCLVTESSQGYIVVSMEGTKTQYYKLERTIEAIPPGGKNVLIAGFDDISVNYGTKLVNEFDYEAVLRYDNKSEDFLTSLTEDEVLFSDNITVSLWNKGQIELLSSDSGLYTFMTFSDTEILVIPEGSDCCELEEKYLTPDIIITSGMSDNMGRLSCETLIVPGDSYEALVTAERLAPIAQSVITGTDIEYTINLK